MNSKERVKLALNYKKPDRIPVDFWAEDSVKKSLMNYLNLKDEDELINRLGVDIRSIYPKYIGPQLKTFSDGSFEDFWGIIRKPVKNPFGLHYEVADYPFGEISSLKNLEKYRWPQAEWFDYSSLEEELIKFNEYGICIGKMGRECQTIFIQTWFLRGIDKILMDMLVNPDIVELIISKILEFRLAHLAEILKITCGKADWIQVADDYGTQNGLFMKPEIWRKFFKKPLKTMVDLIHKYDVKAFLHSCGSIREIIPDLIEIGIDILNPIQVRAHNMNPELLIKEFGKKICFHGSIDTQETMSLGSKEDIINEVKQRIITFGKDGGFILSTTHTIESDISLENILTLYDTIKKYNQI